MIKEILSSAKECIIAIGKDMKSPTRFLSMDEDFTELTKNSQPITMERGKFADKHTFIHSRFDCNKVGIIENCFLQSQFSRN